MIFCYVLNTMKGFVLSIAQKIKYENGIKVEEISIRHKEELPDCLNETILTWIIKGEYLIFFQVQQNERLTFLKAEG